jgi:predicted nucleic-acid-binding protein
MLCLLKNALLFSINISLTVTQSLLVEFVYFFFLDYSNKSQHVISLLTLIVSHVITIDFKPSIEPSAWQ